MLENLLAAWTRKVVSGAAQINKKLKEHGYTWEDVEEYLDSGKTDTPFLATAFRAVLCPHCKENKMLLEMVNTCAGNQVGGDYKSRWYCEKCDVSIMNKESMLETIERHYTNAVLTPQPGAYDPEKFGGRRKRQDLKL